MEIEKKSIKSLEFDKICEKLAMHTRLKQSSDLCLEMSIYSDTSYIQTALNFTQQAKSILDRALELPIEFVADIESIKKSTLNSYLCEQDIIDVAKTIRTSRLVKNFLRENTEESSPLAILATNLFSDKDFEDKIFSVFDENFNVRQDATSDLKGLFASLRETEKNIKKKVSELLNSATFSKHLQEQIYTTRDERIVFQVRASAKSKVPGIVHDVSASSQTFYIEPAQIVPLNNKIRETKSKINAEIIRILADLTRQIKANIDEIQTSEDTLAQIDFHFAKARYAIKTKAVEPEIVMGRYIKFDKMRHPLIEECVANDFEIGKDYKAVVITGSNTGGKTVAIKTVGLFLLMTKAGMFLPCNEAKVYPFAKVFADIGDEQSILQNLSTFSSHMTNIIDIVNQSDENTFVLLDEMCAGTDPLEGAILAQVVLEDLASKNTFCAVTTHYGELKSLEFTNPYFKNASVEFDVQSLSPTYRLVIGIPGLSNAISISANLGLKKEITQRAKDILVSQKDPSILVVEKLQETQQKLAENLKEAEEAREQSTALKTEYEEKLSSLKKDKKKTIKLIKDKFDREMETVKSEIKDIVNEVRRTKSEKIARRSYSRLANLDKKFREGVDEADDKETYIEPDWDNLEVGDCVMLKELNQPVKILSKPDKSDNVFVQMGMIKTKIKKEKLAAYNEKMASQPKTKPQNNNNFSLKRHDISNTLDLRGLRVEEALDDLEVYLDKASLANLSPVYIIHGHGTGALKSAIRDYINTSPYVAKYRPGENSEGGDGVSVIDIF